ncbi:hypothetical protein B0H19DRAFT_1140495 [Mycena capillaripes]|nr:hypothetical protein B0H19DRAFT_1140495 [Mycena capillaripes]
MNLLLNVFSGCVFSHGFASNHCINWIALWICLNAFSQCFLPAEKSVAHHSIFASSFGSITVQFPTYSSSSRRLLFS